MLFCFFCTAPASAGEARIFQAAEEIRTEVWWVAGDAHVTSEAEGLDQAIADINSLGLDLDYAIQLGDHVEDRHEYGSVFRHSMSRLNARRWDYVLGNYDFGRDHMPVFPATYWGETVNGIRFIFLSDEVDGRINRNLVMSDEQRAWFFSELETHRHMPIILFTHQPPAEFEDFENIDFSRYRIKAWFHAHRHRWEIANITEYGFHKLGINAISGHRDPRQSSVLYINGTKKGTEFTLRFRNHASGEWIEADGYGEYFFFVPAETSGGDCFIASAAYGSPIAEEISALTDFRDAHLLTNIPGRAVSEAYYSLSPPFAEAVRGNRLFRSIARLHISPLVKISGLITASN